MPTNHNRVDIANQNSLPERLIGRRALTEMLGGISMMTLWRREHEPGFPKKMKIGGGVFWRLSDVMNWIDLHAQDDGHISQRQVLLNGGTVEAARD
ncbi:MAG: AlpA family phage regulatory protein [Rhodospirillaceae bacterium]|jgi:predicted DNA-binding transcriptional regulator AlpA|nr:AlpA family phage regulatory protein [Rhodospirillaceae bacterium]MBT5243209.1 AlpA family phage regulatory protein [Rhodospirillaceae bacterium]MBT6243748.1 AlpA family phage regulatory protein [Rhodospirillaceae bacterium]